MLLNTPGPILLKTDTAREELAELLLDEARQAVSVTPVGGFP